MAEKLSINIDLRDSRRVKQKSTPVHDKKVHSESKKAPIEFIYRYDRMFTVFLVLFLIIIGIYFAVKAFLSEPESVSDKKQAKTYVEQVVSTPDNPVEEAPVKPAVAAPVEQTVVASVEPAVAVPVEQTINTPEEPVVAVPVEQTINTPEEPVVAAPLEQTITSPVEPAVAVPVKQTINTPEEPTVAAPVEQTINTPEEPVVAEPVEQTVTAPVESAVAVPVEQTINTLEEPVVAALVEQTVTAPVEPAVAVPVEQTINTPEEPTVAAQKVHDGHFIQNFSENLRRVLLVSNIYKKEPINKLSYWVTGQSDRAEKVYLFTQWDNNAGKSIEHQWWHQGKMITSKKFHALGNRWRCYSSKNLGKFQQGEWEVRVLDQKGKILSVVNFHYQIN